MKIASEPAAAASGMDTIDQRHEAWHHSSGAHRAVLPCDGGALTGQGRTSDPRCRADRISGDHPRAPQTSGHRPSPAREPDPTPHAR